MTKWGKALLMVKVVNTFKRSAAYKREGDSTLDAVGARFLRERLKKSPALQAEIRRFWGVIDMLKDSTGNLTRHSYIVLNVKLQKAMVSDFDQIVAERDAAADWAQDLAKFAAARERRQLELERERSTRQPAMSLAFLAYEDGNSDSNSSNTGGRGDGGHGSRTMCFEDFQGRALPCSIPCSRSPSPLPLHTRLVFLASRCALASFHSRSPYLIPLHREHVRAGRSVVRKGR